MFSRRLKISHDPNNLVWSQAAESYGQKLLASQGWKPGQGLGARNAKHFNSSAIPKLAISYKDDTLGLGASLKSQDPIHTRTGLDAFQGLLGRLNGKSDVDLKEDLQKTGDRKLAMWAQGRWGSVMFVPGGTLVQGDGYKTAENEVPQTAEPKDVSGGSSDMAESKDLAQRKAEKKKRQEEKRRKGEADHSAITHATTIAVSCPGTHEAKRQGSLLGLGPGVEKTSSKEKRKKERERPTLAADDDIGLASRAGKELDSATPTSSEVLPQTPAAAGRSTSVSRTGRHVIRGRNIEAKRMAFSDTKMLDQVFVLPWTALPSVLIGLPDIHGEGLMPVMSLRELLVHSIQDRQEL